MIKENGFVLRCLSTRQYVRSVTAAGLKFTSNIALALRFKTPEAGLHFVHYLELDWLVDDIVVIDSCDPSCSPEESVNDLS